MDSVAYAGLDDLLPPQDDTNATREAGTPLSAPSRGLATAIEVSGPSLGNPWSTPATCTTYSMVLKAGRYTLEAWGGRGGCGSGKLKSNGGYSKAELDLDKDTRIFAVAGGNGEIASKSGETAAGGCNGGGNGIPRPVEMHGENYGGGGGASHVSAVEDSLNHRILVAGGSGGSFHYASIEIMLGGQGGGNNGENGDVRDDGFLPGFGGQGASQTGPGNGCVSESGCFAGNFGNGGTVISQYGCGGGGGWFGGASSYGYYSSGGGGSGFIFEGKNGTGCSEIDDHPLIGIIAPLKDGISEVGQSESGKVTITLISVHPTASPSPSASASPTASASASSRPPTKISNIICNFQIMFLPR